MRMILLWNVMEEYGKVAVYLKKGPKLWVEREFIYLFEYDANDAPDKLFSLKG